ncbi:MAG: hypothetical protein KDK55_04875 [Chlamydiia bacterium]|nr:hypothetical protein [Chlamydiia bacterium]
MKDIYGCFGYHTSTTAHVREYWELPKKIHKKKAILFTVINIAGYIPVVGAATAVVRCVIILSNPNKSIAFTVTMMGRGVVEFFGLGSLFLIPDVIVTFHRFYHTPRKLSAQTNIKV